MSGRQAGSCKVHISKAETLQAHFSKEIFGYLRRDQCVEKLCPGRLLQLWTRSEHLPHHACKNQPALGSAHSLMVGSTYQPTQANGKRPVMPASERNNMRQTYTSISGNRGSGLYEDFNFFTGRCAALRGPTIEKVGMTCVLIILAILPQTLGFTFR